MSQYLELGIKGVQIVDEQGNVIIVPIDVQSRLQTTIQTHNAVSVAGSNGTSVSTNYIDCAGYDSVGLTLLNDASTSCQADIIWSNDGVTIHGQETLLSSATGQRRAGLTSIKARYLKVQVLNGDAAAHTMSSWVYLKA